MNKMTSAAGTFVISWSQTEVEGLSGAPVSALDAGATWMWRGEAVQIDDCSRWHRTTNTSDDLEACRTRAASKARRLVSRALIQEGVRAPVVEDVAAFDRAFNISDGHRSWTVTLIDMPEIARPLLMFADGMPPDNTALVVTEGVVEPTLPSRLAEGTEGVVCFTPGTWLETPTGPRLVEDLVAGDQLVTKDAGAQSVLWAGSRNVSGARLYAMPDLRPVRIREGALGSARLEGDLIVSPDHRMLVQGPTAQDLWGETEVLVAARDLVDGQGITRDTEAKSVTYHHLMLSSHQVIVANGTETESFHPAAARLDAIAEEQKQRLFDVMPDLSYDTATYGPTVRRVLTPAEAAKRSKAA